MPVISALKGGEDKTRDGMFEASLGYGSKELPSVKRIIWYGRCHWLHEDTKVDWDARVITRGHSSL